MSCFICADIKGRIITCINEKTQEQGKLCEVCVHKPRKFCDLCNKLHALESMTWRQDSKLICDSCKGTYKQKCENCQSKVTCYCSCSCNFCQSCSEKHFCDLYPAFPEHVFCRFASSSFSPDFDASYMEPYNFYISHLEDLRKTSPFSSEISEKLFQIKNLPQKITKMSEFYEIMITSFQIIIDCLKIVYPHENHEQGCGNLQLEVAKLWIYQGRLDYALDILNRINPNGFEIKYLALLTFYFTDDLLMKNPFVNGIFGNIKDFEENEPVIVFQRVKTNLNSLLKQKQSLKKLKAAIMEEKFPILDVVKAFVTCAKIKFNLQFNTYALRYTKDYFQDIPELSTLIRFQIKDFKKSPDKTIEIKQLAEQSVKILLKRYGNSTEDLALALYELALAMRNSQDPNFKPVVFRTIQLSSSLKMPKLLKYACQLYMSTFTDTSREYTFIRKLISN